MNSFRNKVLVIAFSWSALWVARAPAQTSDDLFNDNIVHDIQIVIKPSDWETLKRHYLENTYYEADFHWKFQGRDIVVQSVGIRSRGRGSRSPIKPNLRVDFNRFVEKQSFLGLGSLVMKANNQDGSFLRERLVFKLFGRMGLPASRQTHVRLFINNDYRGLYLMTEEIRKEYMERYVGEGNGDLYEYKPLDEGWHFEWRATCRSSTQLACGTDSTKWAPAPFDPEEHKNTFDIRPTIALVRVMNDTADADFERVMADWTDLKLWLVHNALEVFAADFDSILGDVFGLNNFFVYRYDGKNLHQFVVWDKDGSFNSSQRPIFQNADQNVLMRRTLAISARRAQYLEALTKVAVLAGGPGGWLESENEREYNQIRQAAYDDPVKLYGESGVVKPSTPEIFEAFVAENRKFVQARTPFVLNAVVAAGFSPAGGPTLNPGGAVNAAPNASPSAPIAPGSLVSLYGSALTDTIAQATAVPLPTTLGGVTVYINGFEAPLLFVSPTQINLQVPWEVGQGTVPFTVMMSGPPLRGSRTGSPLNATLSNTIAARVGLVSPGVFAVVQADYSLTTSKPAGAGDVLLVFANGLGAVDNPVATGQAAGASPLSLTTFFPSVTIGGVAAKVLFSGLAPGFVGLYQINVEVPTGVTPGASTPLGLSIGGQTAAPVTIATR